jgi:hypothetical protein
LECHILREKYFQIPFLENDTILDFIPQHVPGGKWNYVEAPHGIRCRTYLKSMLINNKNYAKFKEIIAISLSLFHNSRPSNNTRNNIKTFNTKRNMPMIVLDSFILV